MERDVWGAPLSRVRRFGASECSVQKFGTSSEQPCHAFTALAAWTGLHLEVHCILQSATQDVEGQCCGFCDLVDLYMIRIWGGYHLAMGHCTFSDYLSLSDLTLHYRFCFLISAGT